MSERVPLPVLRRNRAMTTDPAAIAEIDRQIAAMTTHERMSERDERAGLSEAERADFYRAYARGDWLMNQEVVERIIADRLTTAIARAESAEARVAVTEAAVERVRAVLADPRHRWWHTGDDCSPLYAVRDALAHPHDQTAPTAVIDAAHLSNQRDWSGRTFGPGTRLLGVLDHIRKELREIEDDPTDVEEWVDVIILAFDGAWREGWEPQEIIDAIKAKQAKNEARTWPDWRTADPDTAIEHVRRCSTTTDQEAPE